jgi:integrase
MSERHITVWVQHRADRPHDDLQWIDPVTGSRRSRTAGTCNPRDAELKRAALEYELNHGLYREATHMSWERFRKTFEDEYVSAWRPTTRNNYAVTLDLFERLCKPGRLRSIDARTVSQFATAIRREQARGRGSKESSVRQRLTQLHCALSWAVRQKLIPEVPLFPAIKVPRKRPQPIPAESFERLLEKTRDHQLSVFLLCGWKAGLRLNEGLALEWEETDQAPWLDPARGRIWLPAGFVKAVEDQWVPLESELYEAIAMLPRTGPKVFRFVGVRSGKPVTDKAMSHRISRLARQAGVRLTMQSLRKGFGCRYAGKVPAQVLQKLMRHSNIRVTMDYYANVDDAVMQAVLGDERTSFGAARTNLRTSETAPEPVPEAANAQIPQGQGDKDAVAEASGAASHFC